MPALGLGLKTTAGFACARARLCVCVCQKERDVYKGHTAVFVCKSAYVLIVIFFLNILYTQMCCVTTNPPKCSDFRFF